MKILVGDFNAQLGRKDIVKPTIGNESLHHGSNDNDVRIINLANQKRLVVKSNMFPH